MKNFITMKLPNDNTFETWETAFTPKKTYHVAQHEPNASDDNDGSKNAPFKTINKAAFLLKAGEEVIVHEGVYHEWVNPVNGGNSPEEMISYKAAKDEDVVIKGTDDWAPEWIESPYIRSEKFVSWQATLKGSMFEGANPFCLLNGRMDRQWGWNRGFEQCRGMIFLNGERIEQVSEFHELIHLDNKAGVFWIEENGMTIHLRLKNDANPNRFTFEMTTREQVFAPLKRYLNYIKLSGFKMFYAANCVPIPFPQKGLLSANAGHHWIIEDCEIGYANTIGIDVGGQWWYYGKGEIQGYHIIRRNHIHHYGVCGIAGWHNMTNQSMLVEDNLLTDNCTMQIEGHCENAAIKIHRTFDSLIRRNVVVRTYHGASIWLDGEIYNTRITQNVCIENHNCTWGQIFLEINEGPNMVDNNILCETYRFNWGNGVNNARGFHSHDAEKVIIAQNFIFNGEDEGIHVEKGNTDRTSRPFENDFRIYGNIIGAYRQMVSIPNKSSKSDFNMFAVYHSQLAYGFVANGKNSINYDEWLAEGFDGNSTLEPIIVKIDKEKLRMSVTALNMIKLPEFIPIDEELLPGLVSGKDAFTHDLLSAERKGRFSVGAIIDMPLDGTEISIDPRMPA